MKITFLFLFSLSTILSAQVDWVKWKKNEAPLFSTNKVKSIESDNNSSGILTILKDSYSFFISDLDGDNCPFYPTCSNFFVESVTETNVFQGTLMFVDRFTRDSNLFKSHEHYAMHKSGRFYDPIENYKLEGSAVIYYSRNRIVE